MQYYRCKEVITMTITATELKNDLSKYLQLAESEDVFITKNGRVMCKLSSPYVDKMALLESLVGILPEDATIEEGKEEKIFRHENRD